MTCLSCIVNTMGADDLVTKGDMASAALIMTYLFWNIVVSAPEG